MILVLYELQQMHSQELFTQLKDDDNIIKLLIINFNYITIKA